MKKMTMTLFARTPVHVGAGNSVGAIDSPVQRERHTRIPIIPGSSLKGVISDLWNEQIDVEKDGVTSKKWVRSSDGKKLFGEDDSSKDAKVGSLLIGEARALAFPVRSAKGMFAWITCPMVLNRFGRDADKAISSISLGEMECLASDGVKLDDSVVLEEYRIKVKGSSADVASILKSVCSDEIWTSLSERLVVLSDELFSYFVEQACEVVSRIRIDDETGVVAKGALFNQEQVPSETLFYSSVIVDDVRVPETEEWFKEKLNNQLIQVGGDASTGLGYCSVEVF